MLQEVCELAPTLPARSKIPGVRQGPILASAAARKQPPGTVGQPPGQASWQGKLRTDQDLAIQP